MREDSMYPSGVGRRSGGCVLAGASAEPEAKSTKPGLMAGLRCLRDLPLAKASDQVALTLSCLLP